MLHFARHFEIARHFARYEGLQHLRLFECELLMASIVVGGPLGTQYAHCAVPVSQARPVADTPMHAKRLLPLYFTRPFLGLLGVPSQQLRDPSQAS